MKKKLNKNILIPCLIGAFVGIGSMILNQNPLLQLFIIPAIFVPLSIGQHRGWRWRKIWIVSILSMLLWAFVIFVVACLAKNYRWAQYILYFPFYSHYM